MVVASGEPLSLSLRVRGLFVIAFRSDVGKFLQTLLLFLRRREDLIPLDLIVTVTSNIDTVLSINKELGN